ncbi:hypothetical protein [Hymenobacter ruricola]|uniref:YtxH domain-containing protein n=1 Tax=Hymenobacter ruricola TaxID=2791023 RepID=A0ABS0I7X7_9BACT|nr:hypothetical protein [Hymenobacter ruricola]MBF9222793.1 hypothetical protein [Hymenobacter ruricola]
MKTSHPYGPLLEKVGSVFAIAAAIAFGTARLLDAGKDEEEEMDATDHLLRTPANRRRLLAAVERDKNRQLIARQPLETKAA